MKDYKERLEKNRLTLMQNNQSSSGVSYGPTQLITTEMQNDRRECREGSRTTNINIVKEDMTVHLRKMSNWITPGPDDFHCTYKKKITSHHPTIVDHLDEYIKT